jgi:hypothetical protein
MAIVLHLCGLLLMKKTIDLPQKEASMAYFIKKPLRFCFVINLQSRKK